MNKVFYIATDAGDVFYVKAENAETAKELLLEEIGKYIFKRNLSGDTEYPWPNIDTLGSNIIVEYNVRKNILSAKFTVEDITAAAFIFSDQGKSLWKNWTITEEDVLA